MHVTCCTPPRLALSAIGPISQHQSNTASPQSSLLALSFRAREKQYSVCSQMAHATQSLLGYILCPAPRVWLREWRTSPSLLLYLGSTSIVDMVPARRDGPTLRPNMVGHIGMSIQLLGECRCPPSSPFQARSAFRRNSIPAHLTMRGLRWSSCIRL